MGKGTRDWGTKIVPNFKEQTSPNVTKSNGNRAMDAQKHSPNEKLGMQEIRGWLGRKIQGES